MDIGRLKLPVAGIFRGFNEDSLRELHTSLFLQAKDIAVCPGPAMIEASATVNAGKALNINNGKVRHADAATNLAAIGICIKGALTGQKAQVMLGMGYVGGLSGLTANSSIYLGNAGALLFAKPGAGFIQALGWTLSNTELFVTISQP